MAFPKKVSLLHWDLQVKQEGRWRVQQEDSRPRQLSGHLAQPSAPRLSAASALPWSHLHQFISRLSHTPKWCHHITSPGSPLASWPPQASPFLTSLPHCFFSPGWFFLQHSSLSACSGSNSSSTTPQLGGLEQKFSSLYASKSSCRKQEIVGLPCMFGIKIKWRSDCSIYYIFTIQNL